MTPDPPFQPVRLSDFLGDFAQGANMGIDPVLLAKNQAGNLFNATVRGDFVTHRPPYNQLPLTYPTDLQSVFENGLWQGGAFYKDDYGNPFLVAAISGRLLLFTPSGSGFSVTEITIPGDPNPATVPQAWLWQAEKWLIWNDGQSVPVIYDGTSSRRTIQGSATVGTTATSDFAIPAVGSTVTLTLAANYTNAFNILVSVFNATGNLLGYFQTVSGAGPTYSVQLTNNSGAAQTVNTGDQIIVPATGGTTDLIGFVQNSLTLQPGGKYTTCILQAPVPANISGNLFNILLQSGQACQTIGLAVGVTQFQIRLQPGQPGPVTITGQALRSFGGTNTPPSQAYPVGKITGGPFTFAIGETKTVTIDTPYSGPASGQAVTINMKPYTAKPAAATTPTNQLTVINLSASPDTGATKSINIGSTIRLVPELPPGRMGTYGLGRNWISLPSGTQFVASDQVGGASGTAAFNKRDAVLRFQENTFLAGGGAFPVPSSAGEITAMIFMSNLDASLGQGPLMVHTPDVVFSCTAGLITDRVQWQNVTSPILSEALKPRGGLSQKSTINANSDQLFRTAVGIQSLILGRRDFNVWGNVPQSFEVDPVLSQDDESLLGFSSAIEFDNRALFTAQPQQGPNGVFHDKLVVLNYDPVSSLRGKQPSVYDGVWDDLKPFQMIVGRFKNTERAFAFCFNSDTGKNELWEILPSSTAQSSDNGFAPIVLDFESSVLFHEKDGEKRTFKRLENGEIYVQEISDPEVLFETFYQPDSDPIWHPWHSWCVKQTPSWQPRMGLGEPPAVSDPDTGRLTRDGYFFQFRLRITGRCTLLGARFLATTQPEPMFATPMPECEPEPAIDFSLSHPPTPPTIVAPSAYWAFETSVNDGAGSSHFVDSTAGATNLSYITGIFNQVAGKIGQAVDQGDTAHSLNTGGSNPTPFTYNNGGLSHSFWVKILTSALNSVGPFISLRYGPTDYGLRLQNKGSGSAIDRVEVYPSAADTNFTALTNNVWNHIVFTITNAGDYVFYVNGVSTATGNAGAVVGNATRQFILSQQAGGATYDVDEVGLWVNHVLTQDEVTFLYNRGTGVTYPW